MVKICSRRQGFAIGCTIVQVVESSSSASTPSAFAGFGGPKPTKKGKKIKTKKRGFADIAPPSSPIQDSVPTEPQLDKWGLPEATLEDLFPLLPQGTELTPADPNAKYSLSDIQACLNGHIDLQLDRSFDENCIEKKGGAMRLKLLHQSPPVIVIENFFTEADCEDMKQATKSAHQVDSATFAGALSTRTSTSWFCHFRDVPVLLAKANRILNIPLQTMEEPQVVRYQKGQEFSWHYDEVPRPQLENGGQRLATLLVYLTDVDDACGGGTAFRDLIQVDGSPVIMQPKQGSALLFFPAFRDGSPDDRTLHRSESMTCDDEKWIVQMWVHKDAYSAVLPPGNSNIGALSAMNSKLEEMGYDIDNDV